jgi:hypothetical protein
MREDQSDVSTRWFLVGLMMLASLLYLSLVRETYLRDFRAYYVASLVMQDHLDPYTNQVNISERYDDGLWAKARSRFIYPPTALIFFSPLGKLGYNRAKLAFSGLSLVVLVGILDFFHRQFPKQTLVLFALFLSLPVFANVDNGQVDILILGLVLGSFYTEDGWKAGTCLAVAVGIKLVPMLLIPWCLASRRWRTVLWSVVAEAVLSAIVVLHWGRGLFGRYYQVLLETSRMNKMVAIVHQFTESHVFGNNRVLQTPDGIYDVGHVIYGLRQNPLVVLGRISLVIEFLLPCVYLVWMVLSRRGRALNSERSFVLFLVVCLFANGALWPMGLVACFPLLILLVDTSKMPQRAALTLLIPMFLPVWIVGNRNFLLWVVVAGYWVVANGWLGGEIAGSILHGDSGRDG